MLIVLLCVGAKKERRLKKSVAQEAFLPHCLQKPTRLADGLGLGGVLPFYCMDSPH